MRVRYLAAIVGSAACARPELEAREREIAEVVVRADEPLILTRPELVADKYRAMAEDPLSSVVLGAGKMLSDFNLLRKISID